MPRTCPGHAPDVPRQGPAKFFNGKFGGFDNFFSQKVQNWMNFVTSFGNMLENLRMYALPLEIRMQIQMFVGKRHGPT